MLKRRLRNVSESHRDASQRLLNPRYRDFKYVLKWHYTYLKLVKRGKGTPDSLSTSKAEARPARSKSDASADF